MSSAADASASAANNDEKPEAPAPAFRCTVSSMSAPSFRLAVPSEVDAETQQTNKDKPATIASDVPKPPEALPRPQQQQQHPELDWSCLENGHLFGRDNEIRQLQEVFERKLSLANHNGGRSSDTDIDNSSIARTKAASELLLVSGASGTGKTALVKKALHEVVEQHGGHFLFGKFDQLAAASEPYRPFVAALTQLAIALEADTSKSASPERILEEVGLESCRALCELVPVLGRPLGLSQEQQRAFQKAHSHQFAAQQDRIKVAMIKLFQVVCSSSGHSSQQRARPVVLIMDDLQWADMASLELLENLVGMDMNGQNMTNVSFANGTIFVMGSEGNGI